MPRLFSIVLWYHLGFLAVSLAMLGLALGGHLVRRRVAATGEPGGGFDRRRLAALAALGVAFAPAIAVRVPVDPASLLDSASSGAAPRHRPYSARRVLIQRCGRSRNEFDGC